MSDSTKKPFDTGVSATLPNVDFSDGIYEVDPPTGIGIISKGSEGIDETSSKTVDEVNTDGSIDKKVKDTAGASAMIL